MIENSITYSRGGMVAFSGILEGVIGNVLYGGGTGLLGRLSSRRIRITSPRPLETLEDPKAIEGCPSYAVRGTLKHLPRDHAIWLLIQDERTNRIWPQSFASVQFDQSRGEWFGRITDLRDRTTRIIAVVAPPTSRDFFTYYQNCGRRTDYMPLNRVPPECWNRDEVQAKVP